MTKKLSFCLRAIKTLDDQSLNGLTDSIEAYTRSGMETLAAEKASVADLLAQVANERGELVDLLREQHADLFLSTRERPLGSTAKFSDNKIFTADKVQAARARLRAKLGRTSAGLDPEMFVDVVTIAGGHIEAGMRAFKDFVAAMVEDLGEGVRPYLLTAYEGVRHYPGLDAQGMTAPEQALREHNEMLAGPAKEQDDGQDDTGAPGVDALGEVATPQGGDAEGVGDALGSDSGSGITSPASNDRADRPRVSRARSGGSGSTSVRAPAPRTRSKARPVGAEGDRPEGNALQGVEPVSVGNVPAVNFRITDDVRLGKGGEVEKFNDNLAAVQVLKRLEGENRRATYDEQRKLARYVGWGGLANAFPNPTTKEFKPEWKVRGEALRDLLTPQEYDLARRSTLDSHYTSTDVVTAMWSAARRLGFTGGTALESSMGIGNFLGLMPDALLGHTRFVGIEYDSLTARMAAALYPQDTVLHSGFQDVPLSDRTFDLAIGNPPFGKQSLHFQFKPELRGASIHNQFIRASLDAVKPGGLSVQVVSRFLMDKIEPADRQALAKKAKLLGAIRLPNTAFQENARTQVVTDILFFQRLTESEEQEIAQAFEAQARGAEKVSSLEAQRMDLARKVPAWTKVSKVKDPLGGEDMTVNSYFVANPSMVLGTMDRSGTHAQHADMTVQPNKGVTLAADLARAVAQLPENVTHLNEYGIANSLERFQAMSDSLKIGVSGQERGAIVLTADGKLEQVIERETPGGDYELAKRELTETSPWSDTLLQDSKGRWYTLDVQIDPETGKPAKMVNKEGKATKRNVMTRKVFEKETDISPGLLLGAARLQRLKEMAGLRDLFVAQINLETQDAPANAMEANRKELAAAYQAFTDKHGWVNDPANAALVTNMPDGALVLALEDKYRPAITPARAKAMGEATRGAVATPMPILTRRVIPKYEPPTRAATGADALAISLSESGRIDLARMADLLQTDEQGVIDQLFTNVAQPLMFKDPETERWETRNDYLSGQVRRKFNAAKGAGLYKNAEALEAVQPEPWTAENVTALLGSTWVPPKFYEDFAVHITGNRPRISYSKLTNTYTLGKAERTTGAKREEWGTEAMDPLEIIDAMLNTKPVRVYDRTDDGPRINLEQTALAQLKSKQIATEFSDWVFADGERRTELVDTFNELYNTRVVRQYDGSHLVLPGKVPDAIIKMRRHQKNAIWRGIYERFMLTDHVVGAGKTYTAISRAMERRRMGLSKKPAIIVPNHLVEEWTNAVYKLYPGAKVLAAGKNDFERSRRRKVFAKIASGDWDIVIIPHSSFGFIGIAPETEQRFLEQELTAAEAAIKEAEKAAAETGQVGFRKPFGVKEAERLRDKIQARMDKIKGADKRDRLLTFEQLGIDDLTVDEAHEFKNLFYSSRLTDVKGMGNKTGSQKAFDLYNKVRILAESPTGSVHFMTGTPISNSAVEMYNMMRYLAAAQLDELGLNHFDAWRAQFVSTDPGWEANETGRLKEVNRLGRTWSNMRSLMDLYYSFTDSVSNDDIKAAYAEDNGGKQFPIPKVKGGDRQSVVIDPTPAQVTELERVIAGFDALPNETDPYERNIKRLKLMDRARKVSLDVRAASPGSASRETGGKLEVIAENVHRIYKAWDADKGTQLVFLDRSVPKAKGDDKQIAAYDALIAEREAALRAGDEEAYRIANDKLDGFNSDEIEALRNAQSGGWNAYQQIKDNLVALGVPEREIRFVQEANNDAQKQALFDAVNAGEVRVLIGSTPRMGAGTNVQQRLVGLHHADVTWKPSDIEQREGRIIRQGNGLLDKYGIDKFEVEILAYATERTIDAKMWGLNSAKLRTINGIRKYSGDFTMEFEDAESVSMAELAALASGDPLLLERVQIDSDITKLELLERQHRRKQWGIEGSIDTAKAAIKSLPGSIAAQREIAASVHTAADTLSAAMAARKVKVEGQNFTQMTDAIAASRAAVDAQRGGNESARFSITIDGKKYTAQAAYQDAIHQALGDHEPFDATVFGEHYTTRVAAGREIAARASEIAAKLPNGGAESLDMGTLAGQRFEAEVSSDRHGGSFKIEFTVTDAQGHVLAQSVSIPRETFEFTTQGLAKPLADLKLRPEHADSLIESYTRALERHQADLPQLEARRGGEFKEAPELAQKRLRLEEVTRQLANDTPVSTDNAQQAAADQLAENQANPDIASPMPDLSIEDADFQDTQQTIPVPEIASTEPVSTEDAHTVSQVEQAVRAGVPSFRALRLTALSTAPKPGPGAHEVVAQRYVAAQLMESVYGKRTIFFSANMPFANGMAPTGNNNVVMVNEASTRPIMALLGHEMLHRLRADAPALYARLHGRLMDLVREPGRYADQLAARYRKGGMEALPEGKMQEELIADIVGDFHTEPRFWRDMARAQGGAFRRVLAAVLDFWDNLLSKLKSERPYGTELYLKDVEAARAAVVEAMADYANRKGEHSVQATEADMSFGGDPFYSELAHQITRTAMNSGSVESWRQLLKSLHTKGVKADEIAWTGIEDWLALQSGKVSREQVLDYLNANGVKVTETVLSDDGKLLDADGRPIDDGVGGHVMRGLPTKYGQYTLPGGSNYREVLLTLPVSEGQTAKKPLGIFGLTAGRNAAAVSGLPAPFRSLHWEQPNVVAHIRLNDRTDSDGKKVLFVEELQSDWGQAGKKQGFATAEDVARLEDEETAQRAVLNRLWLHRDSVDDAKRAEYRAAELKLQWIKSQLSAPRAAPFITKTDAWVGLALKRVIKMAVDGGYDRVALINGEQSAERYDLSKQVSAIDYWKNDDGTFRVRVRDMKDDTAWKSDRATGPELADTVGKEIADKIVNGEGKQGINGGANRIEGLDLKVGGKGMKTFYEKIVPKVAKELVRKLGGEGLTVINFGEPQVFHVGGRREDVSSPSTQLGFDITPAMVEKAAGGLPMMSLGGNYTPDQKTALAKAGINTRTRLQRAGDRIRAYYPRAVAAWQSNWARQFQQGALDQFTGINVVEKTLLGNMAPDQSAYVAARLANGGTSSVMRGLMLHGQARWASNGQHLEKVPGTEGLLDIFRPLGGDLNDFFGWMIGNRAARLKAEGRENNLSDDEIKALRDLNKGKEAEFRRAALKYAAFKRSVLDVAEGAGLIDTESRKVWDQADYIPFYREVDEKAVFSPTGKKGLAGQSSGIRTLKGGTGALNDPMENIIMNFSRLIDASLKNNALRKTVSMVVDAGSDIVEKVGYDMTRQLLPAAQIRKRLEAMGTPDVVLDNIPPGALEGMAKMWAIQAPTDPDVVRVMVNGKPQFYKVNDPLLLKSLTSFVPFDFPGLGVMRAFKRLLTGAVTATPEFMARNYIRDSVASQMIGRTGFNPAKSLTGIGKSLMESGGFEDMLFAGASFQSGNIDAGDPVATGRAMRRALRKRGFDASSANAFMGSIVDTPAKFWDGYRKFGESIENANREAIYEATLKKTQSITSAAYEAKDLMDFSLRGSSPLYQLFADVLPFFNARVQGLYRAGRADPKRLIAYGVLMMALSLALAIENWDNPEYEALPDWDKDTYWHFWIKGQHFRLPKPFELGVVFATIPERVLRYAKDHDTGKKLASRVWANMRDQLAFDPIPQALRPAASVWANKDTFRDRPIETMSDEGKLPSQRFGAMTSPTAREAVQLANVGGAMDTIGLSPRKLEYLVGGYLGTTGLYALGLADMAVDAMNGAPPKPQMRLDEYPLVRTFYRMEPARATVYESDLYEMRDKASKIYKSVMAQGKGGDTEGAIKLAEENRDLLAVRPAIERQAKTLSELNKLRDQVFASRTLTPKEKRIELDRIQVQKNALTKATMTAEPVRATQ